MLIFLNQFMLNTFLSTLKQLKLFIVSNMFQHKFLQDEARAAVLDAVYRAEEQAWQNELKRMMERNEEIEEENYLYDAPM